MGTLGDRADAGAGLAAGQRGGRDARRSRLLLALLPVALAAGACGGGTGTSTSSSSAPTTSAPPASNPGTTTTTTTTTTLPATTSTSENASRPGGTTVQVWFLDGEHARTGEEPLFRPVERRVEPPALAAGALDALFAGPTGAERADGLDLVLSGATGYAGLHIDGGIASVRLEGGCSSGGSTITIAGEIVPTLKQFASVDYVKIYAPDGTTERPSGVSDSIPTCLEP